MERGKLMLIISAIIVLVSLIGISYFTYRSKDRTDISKKEISDIGGDYEEDLAKISQNIGVSVEELEKENIEDIFAPREDGIYSLQEVSWHSGESDCWMAIHGKVYDVTDYIKDHPGEDNILAGCGEDATELFETRPMGSGKPHSQKARDILSQYEIGKLKTDK